MLFLCQVFSTLSFSHHVVPLSGFFYLSFFHHVVPLSGFFYLSFSHHVVPLSGFFYFKFFSLYVLGRGGERSDMSLDWTNCPGPSQSGSRL